MSNSAAGSHCQPTFYIVHLMGAFAHEGNDLSWKPSGHTLECHSWQDAPEPEPKKIKLHLTISYAASRCQFDKQHRQYLDTYPPCRSCVVRPLDVEYDTSSTSLPSWEGLAAAFPILDEILGSGSSSRWHSLLLGQASNACFHYCLFCLCILLVIQNR